VTAKTLREAIVTQASRDSYLMADEALVYERLGKEFAGHGTVSHSPPEPSSALPRIERKPRRSSRNRDQAAETRQKRRS
jgi:hypothetical protein